MKTASLLLFGLLFLQSSSFAQSSKSSTRISQTETVILNRDNSETTTIEINENGVYLNGEQVATRSDLNNKNLNKKIIIHDNSRKQNTRDYDDYYNSGRSENNVERRALLGVFTDARKAGSGAYIERVSPNSAAEKAGLKSGDIITRIDSSNIYNAEDLTNVIRNYRPGDKITVSYNRNGRDRQTTAILKEVRSASWSRIYDDPYMNDIPPIRLMPRISPFGDDFFNENKPRLGISVEDGSNGVVVRNVHAGSIAATAGLRIGDIITYADNNKIETVDELQRMVSNAKPGAEMKIEVDRNGARVTRTVRFPREQNIRDL